jgi:hypothetical protein
LLAALAVVIVASSFLVTWKWLDAEQQPEYAEDTTRREAPAREETEYHQQEARPNLYAANVCLAQWARGEGRVDIVLPLLEEAARRPTADADLRRFEGYYLQRLARPEGLTLRGHSDAVRGVPFDSGGRRLAPAGSDQTVRIREYGPQERFPEESRVLASPKEPCPPSR